MANPFYPMHVLFFKGALEFPDRVWSIFLRYPIQQINAFISEYKIWFFSLIISPLVFFIKNKRQDQIETIKRLVLIGIINFFIFTTFISGPQEEIMVSIMRYSLPVFIPLILSLFLLGQLYKKEELLSYIAIACMILINPISYYPKLLFIYLPLAYVIFQLIDKRNSFKH